MRAILRDKHMKSLIFIGFMACASQAAAEQQVQLLGTVGEAYGNTDLQGDSNSLGLKYERQLLNLGSWQLGAGLYLEERFQNLSNRSDNALTLFRTESLLYGIGGSVRWSLNDKVDMISSVYGMVGHGRGKVNLSDNQSSSVANFSLDNQVWQLNMGFAYSLTDSIQIHSGLNIIRSTQSIPGSLVFSEKNANASGLSLTESSTNPESVGLSSEVSITSAEIKIGLGFEI